MDWRWKTRVLFWLAIESVVTGLAAMDVRDVSRCRLPDGRASELL